MGLRLRKSIKIAPGIKLNLSKSGISTTIGKRGSSVNVSKKGVYGSAGIPGTGISYRGKIDGGSKAASKLRKDATLNESDIDTSDMNIFDFDNDDIEGSVEYIQALAAAENERIDEMINIHLKTPSLDDCLYEYNRSVFSEPAPVFKASWRCFVLPILVFILSFIVYGMISVTISEDLSKLTVLFAAATAIMYARRKKKKEMDIFIATHYEPWQERKKLFDLGEDEKETAFVEGFENQDDPGSILEYLLSNIKWTRETSVDYEIDGNLVKLDIDLPEIEDMPIEIYECKGRGNTKKLVSDKKKSESQVRKDYAKHVHGVGMVAAGTVFNGLDNIETVIVSGYTQRISEETGHEQDDYIYSVKIPRDEWAKINFSGLGWLDPVKVLARFDIKRDISKSGVFQAIEPF